RLWSGPPPAPPTGLRVAAVSVPKAGEEVSGDAWAAAQEGGRELVLVADGLGHGPLAAEAAREAVRAFHQHTSRGPAEILQAMHHALRSTRGAAAAVAEVDLTRQLVRYAGVGNVSGAVLSAGGHHNLVSHNGTLGYEARKFQAFEHRFPDQAVLV